MVLSTFIQSLLSFLPWLISFLDIRLRSRSWFLTFTPNSFLIILFLDFAFVRIGSTQCLRLLNAEVFYWRRGDIWGWNLVLLILFLSVRFFNLQSIANYINKWTLLNVSVRISSHGQLKSFLSSVFTTIKPLIIWIEWAVVRV